MGVADTGPTLATSMHDAAPRSFPSRFSSPLPTTAPPSFSFPWTWTWKGDGGDSNPRPCVKHFNFGR